MFVLFRLRDSSAANSSEKKYIFLDKKNEVRNGSGKCNLYAQ